MDVAGLINSILADDGYNALSEDTKSKFEQYLHTPRTVQNEVGTNTSSESGNKPEIDFDVLNNSANIREAKFLEMQKEIEIINDQFKNALKQKHELMLYNETLLKNLHEAEIKERMTKMDDGILQLKIDTLTENLQIYSDKLSSLQAKYHKEINELKPNLDQKEAEVLMFKNDINLLQIKTKNQEDTIDIMKREIEDLNLKYNNDIEQIKIELTNNQNLMYHYKECYEEEVEQTKRLTQNIVENKEYVCSLTSHINIIEKKYSKLSNDYESYVTAQKNTLSVLTNKLNASEEIVTQLLPINSDHLNFLINKDTTITDVYAIYKETCTNLQNVTQELEESKRNFNILEQQILEVAPGIDKLETNLSESNEKVKVLCDTVERLELKLNDVSHQLELSNLKCDQLTKENEKLCSIEDDLSKQVCFLLRNKQSTKHFENRNIGMDMSSQSIISNNYVTFENIQGLQKQNKKLLEVVRSLSKAKDEQEIKLIKDLKEQIKVLEEKLESQTQVIEQQKEKLSQIQSLDSKSKLLKELNDVQEKRIQSPTKITLESNKENYSNVSEENIEYFKQQLSTANITIKQLKEKLESNSTARLKLEQHIQGLNQQIDELLGKIKASNIKHSESADKIANLQSTISALEHKNHEVKIEMDKIKNQYNNLKKENDSMYISNMNYSRELRQKTEFQKEFEKMLASQLDSLILNWNLALAYIAETDFNKVKFKDEYKNLTKTLKDVKDNLLSKLESIEDLSTYKEMPRSRTNSINLCSDERSNFQNIVSKLENEIKSLKSKLNESDQLRNQLKSELNVTKQLYKSLEENLKKMSEYSSQLENEREIKKKEYLEKDQQLLNAMQELSDFNKSQNININKLQSQLDKYEKNQNKLLVELETEKEHNKEHMKTITEQDKTIKILREELETTFNDKNESEKEFNNKITQFKNKLERLDTLELFNKTKSVEIDHLKNLKTAMEKSIIEIKDSHKIQLTKLDDEINCLKETIKRWQFENELLSEQYKSMTTELINMERLNNSKLSDKDDSFSNPSMTQVSDKQFTKMANLINILKEEKKNIILELNETLTERNKLKSELQYKSKVLDDMQIQLKELRQLHSSGVVMDNNHSKILEKIELCNEIVEKNKILEEENTLLTAQLKELQELDAKKSTEIIALKEDMSGMQSLIDQKTAEIISSQRNVARWKERSNGAHSDAEYKQLLNTLEREKGKMTTALDQLKSMKSDKACLEELLKKLETDHAEELNTIKQEFSKLKTKFIGSNKSMDTFKSIIRSYRQKFSDVASEIYKVKVLARRYKHLSEELNNTLSSERSLWQTKLDEQHQGSSRIYIDADERKKLIEQGKLEKKIECESQINTLIFKVQEAEAGLNAAKSEVEMTKAKSEDKEMRAKQLLQQVRSRIQNLSKELDTTRKHRDSLIARLDEAENGSRMQEYQVQINRLDQENRRLVADKEQILLEKDRLSHDIQTLNHRVTALMRQFSNQQVKPSTSTGPDKLPVEPPTANIKPLGPTVNKPQPVHHSVTVNPWRSAAAETPLASIKPMTMQTRSVVVLPTSQTSSTSNQSSMSGTSSSSTTITVHPQQPQSVDISSSGGNALDLSEANSTAQSRHLTSSTLVQHVEGSESTATVSDSNETTATTPLSILPLQQVIASAAAPSVTTAQVSPAISIALVVPQGREQVQTTVSQPTTVSVSTVSPSQSQIDRYSVQNENSQVMESSNSNIASSTASGSSTESEPSVVTACTSGPSCSSLDTTTHSNNTQRKRKADLLVTSYMKRSKSFMPREENRREMEYEAPTSSQRDSEVSNSYTGPETNPQDNNKEVEASTDMEVSSEIHDNNEVDLTSQECTADTNNMNETNDIQNEETEQTTGESTPEHSSSNAEATAMTVVEEDSPEMIHFPEFQNTPVSSASCEEIKNNNNVTSDAESRQNESNSIPIEPQAGTSSDTTDTIGVSQSTVNAETHTLDLEQETVEVLSSENEEDIEIKTVHEETKTNDCPEPEVISVSSSPSKDNEAVREDSPVAGPSGLTSESSTNERKPIIWNESP